MYEYLSERSALGHAIIRVDVLETILDLVKAEASNFMIIDTLQSHFSMGTGTVIPVDVCCAVSVGIAAVGLR